MSIKFNDQLMLWGLGVIQPATPSEVIAFLKLVYPQVEMWPNEDMLNHTFSHWLEKRFVIPLNRKHQLYSLTVFANLRMDVKLRRQRDKARITLLKRAHDASLRMSDCVEKDLDGVSPSSEVSTITQEGSRPVNSGSEPSRAESTRLSSRIYWPRVCEQLNSKVGLDFHTSDIPINRFRYCSFPNLKLLQQASDDSSLERDMTLTQLALSIGVSPRLLTSFTHKGENHYRKFAIGKKGGGEREIASPRFFLKTVQYWIKSYFLCHLKIHESCQAYLTGKSIITNAEQHVGKKFVANIDIENYFGSIKRNHVFSLLRKNEIGGKLAGSIADLVTYEDCLPQGAPTSPEISNALLYEFDKVISDFANKAELIYTRYADDITISGNSKVAIETLIQKCRNMLADYELELKEAKTRIASKNASQRVTGLVVNEKTQPPREYQRKVRAIFYNANVRPAEFVERIEELRGHVSYLKSFDVLKETRHIRRYKMVLCKVKAESNREK